MADEFLHQPHDKLFKRAFSQPETAAAAFQAYLPARLTRHLDITRAELVSGSFVDEHFQNRESDLLYKIPSAQDGSEVLLYVLFEHQAQEDAWTALRLLTYMSRIWERCRREQPSARSLPVILPLVLAQQAGGWKQAPSFGALFDLTAEQRDDFASLIPEFSFQLLALAQLPFDQIAGTPMGIMTLRVLKAQPLGDFLNSAVWDDRLLERLDSVDLRTLMRYILHAAGAEFDKESFANKVAQLSAPKVRNDIMTLAQQFHEEGREEGREEGALSGRIRLLQDFLGLPESSTEDLKSKSLDELRVLHDGLKEAWNKAGLKRPR